MEDSVDRGRVSILVVSGRTEGGWQDVRGGWQDVVGGRTWWVARGGCLPRWVRLCLGVGSERCAVRETVLLTAASS